MTDVKKLCELADAMNAAVGSADHCKFEFARKDYRQATGPDAILELLDELEAARATAEQIRNSVIEECAKVCAKAGVAYNVAVRKETASFLALMIRALKSQQDAAIESKPAEQSVPVLPTHGSFHTGVLVKLLLDSAFEILRPDSPEDCPEEPWMRVTLGKKYWAILTATPRSTESQRSGDGS